MEEYHPESPDGRELSAKRLGRFNELIGLDSLDHDGLIEKIKSMRFEEFLDLLYVANGILVGKGEFQRYEGQRYISRIQMGGVSCAGEEDLITPDNILEILEELFLEMQKNLSPETLAEYSAKLYSTIALGHIFPNGNGRTSRYIYSLMMEESPAKAQPLSERTKETESLCNKLNVRAIWDCYRAYGFDVSKYKDFYDAPRVTFDSAFGGDVNSLRYIAVYEVLKSHGIVIDGNYEMSSFPMEYGDDYIKKFSEVRSEWLKCAIKLSGQMSEEFKVIIEDAEE